MKSNMTPEEATESLRHFLKQHDKRFEHLLALGTILEDIRITDFWKDQREAKRTSYVFHREEIELTLNQRKARLINSTVLEEGKPRKLGTSTLFLADVSPGNNIAPEEQLFSYDRFADVLAISKEEAAFLSVLLLGEFDAFQRFLGTGEQRPPTMKGEFS